MSDALICLGSKPMLNCCGICGGAKDWLLTGTPGCWVTSIKVRSSLACGATWTAGSARPTVPVTALGAGVWGAWVVLAALPSSLDCPLQAPSRSPAITRGKASLRMRIPSGSAESAHRRRAGNATGRGSAAKGRDRDRPSTIPRLAQETSSDDSLEENTDIRNARGMKPAAQRPPAPLHSPILLLPEAKEKLTRR